MSHIYFISFFKCKCMSNVFKVSSIARLLYQQMYKGKGMRRTLQQGSFLSTWNPEYSSTVDPHILNSTERGEGRGKQSRRMRRKKGCPLSLLGCNETGARPSCICVLLGLPPTTLTFSQCRARSGFLSIFSILKFPPMHRKYFPGTKSTKRQPSCPSSFPDHVPCS